MEKTTEKIKLKTLRDVEDASGWVFNQLKEGTMDAKTADALNTTLKGLYFMKGKLRLDYLKLVFQAKVKKVDIPFDVLQLGVE